MNTLETQTSVLENPAEPSSETLPTPPEPKRRWLWVLLTLLLVGGGWGLWQAFAPKTRESQPVAAQTPPPPRPVETVALTTGNGMRRINLLGQVEASERATIRTQTEGVVQQVFVQPGDRVTAGRTIAILDNADQQLALAEAQARLAQERSNLARLQVGTRPEIIAQRQSELSATQAREREALDNVQRTSGLVAQGALSQRTLVEAGAGLDAARGERLRAAAALAEAQAGPTREEIAAQSGVVAAAQSAVNQARLALGRTRVTAPSDGVVQAREVSVGDYVERSSPMVTLVDRATLDVFLEVPEELSSQVTPGLPVTLSARAVPGWQGRAIITGVMPTANATSRRQMVRVRLDNPDRRLLPGMAIQGELQQRSNQPSFVVSRDALVRRGDRWLVYTVANGRARQFDVELVADMGREMAIYHEQLQAGQPVVVRGADILSDGAAVQVKQQ